MKQWLILLLVSAAAVCAAAQPSSTDAVQFPQAQRLFAEERWPELVTLLQAMPVRSADLQFYYASALAQLERWDDARAAFLAGHRLWPTDARFSIELAGVEFKQKRYPQAAAWLRRGLQLNPTDAYANDFLGSVYFVQGNYEAALKYWNRVGKPQIDAVRFDPTPRLKPALLDRAFAFSPAATLTLPDLLTSEARVRGLELFPTFNFDLAAHSDGKFDVVFRAQERNGWGANRLQAAARLLRGVFYQTIYPEYFDVNQAGINVTSLLRWDAQKRRALAALSGPLKGNPQWHYRFAIDVRDENWDLRDSSPSSNPLLAGLKLRKEAVSAAITSLHSGRWSWSTGAEFSHRDYPYLWNTAALPSEMLLRGYQLKHLAQLNYEMLRLPERRFVTAAAVSSEVARLWSEPRQTFAKLQAGIDARWFPQARGDDYEMHEQLRGGRIFGQAPFDELFMLGVERDNALWLRAHPGTYDGRKGNAPLGSTYFLSNWEMDKNLHSNGLVTFKLGPFLDTGKITGAAPLLGSRQWLVDSGVQAKVRAFGLGVGVSYGRDLITGRNVVYVTAGP